MIVRQLIAKKCLATIVNTPLQATISKEEAEALMAKISRSTHSIFKNVVQLQATAGYQALGCATLSNALKKHCPELSNAYSSRLIKSAAIYVLLDETQTYLKWVSENTFRPLYGFNKKDQKAVWAYLIERDADQARISAKQVTNAIEALQLTPVKKSQSPTVINNTLQQQASGLAKKIFEKSQTTSAEEWRAYAKLLYQRLLEMTPHKEGTASIRT